MSANFPYCTPEYNVQQVAEMMSKSRLRRGCCSRHGGELETNWRDYRPRHCVACSGYRQKPRANERARCHVEPPVTVTPEAFYG